MIKKTALCYWMSQMGPCWRTDFTRPFYYSSVMWLTPRRPLCAATCKSVKSVKTALNTDVTFSSQTNPTTERLCRLLTNLPCERAELMVNPLKMLIALSPLTKLLHYSRNVPAGVQQLASARANVPAAALYDPQCKSLCRITSFDSRLVLPVQWLMIIRQTMAIHTKGTLSHCWACGFSIWRAGAGLRQPGEKAPSWQKT